MAKDDQSERRDTDVQPFTLDHERERRSGAPEIIFCTSKTPDQLVQIVSRCMSRPEQDLPLMLSKLDAGKAEILRGYYSNLEYREDAQFGLLGPKRPRKAATLRVVVITAGTSDLPVAAEAMAVLDALGHNIDEVHDSGVAGIHRILDQQNKLRHSTVCIVVAGMDGALPSVVAGLTPAPVIAVPTSVGYGASFGGVAALLTMLNSCSPGLSVVNIDNGLGAAISAHKFIGRLEASIAAVASDAMEGPR